ncbi:MAG: prolyl oligopeptidase family serine peptidase [candidate division WOR-3 bacterium]
MNPVAMTILLTFLYLSPISALETLSDTIFIKEWLLCGPFSVGMREGITEAIPDIANIQPQEGDSLRSGLVQGGIVRWRRVETDPSGWLATDYQDVRWDSIMDYYGISGLLSLGYAYAEFFSPHKARCLAVATRIGSFVLNGRGYIGDVYGNNWFKTPVVIDSGKNRIVLRISGYGDQKVRFFLIPCQEPVIPIIDDITAPDIIADSARSLWLGIPILNTLTEILQGVHLKLNLDTLVIADTTVNHIPRLGVKKPAIRVNIPPLPYDTAGYKMILTITLNDFQRTDTVRLRSRLLTQAHKRTFISEIDSSCQYYALRYPENYDPNKKYGLILSLHGAGVEAYGLAECFQPKDWAFVVCPTNRRPYGFDWQDWGRLDCIEVLKEVQRQFPIDPDRVVLTGHSMGGHGTWHIGLAHPDLFAAIAPEAGWPSFPLYVPNFLQRSIIFTEPGKLAIRDMAARPDNTPAFLENALNLPVFILHGADDDNVPTIHSRNFALWLDVLGYKYHYKEVPGQKHWWEGCVDDPDLMDFLKNARREHGPRHIRFRTADLSQSRTSYWLTIDRVKTIGRDATVAASAGDSAVEIKTENITQLTLNLDQRLFFSGPIGVKIDGKTVIKRLELPAIITLHNTPKGWKLGRARTAGLAKKPELYGPAKQTLMRPFAIVYGTQDSAVAEFLMHAASQECLRWYLIGNGTTEVLCDTEPIPLDRNLILFGGEKENRVMKKIHHHLPITVKGGKMNLFKTELGESLSAVFVYPNPLNPERLILVRMGTDPLTTKLSFFWGIIGSGTAIPDFMIFDSQVRSFGWHGVRAAGFFSPEWQIDPLSTFIQK